jgi:hypothetical protein
MTRIFPVRLTQRARPRQAQERSRILSIVSDTLRPAAGIRITRPYATEDEFLEHELDMLTRTTVTLVGAQSRPQGVVLRFELALTSGQVVLRGEGRVLAFKPGIYRGLGGLTLRFTRLDTRSKALVDKAASLREHRRPSLAPAASVPSLPPPASSAPSLEDPAPTSAPTSVPPPVSPHVSPPVSEVRTQTASFPPTPAPLAASSPDREVLLGRLRARAKALDAADVKRILDPRRRA